MHEPLADSGQPENPVAAAITPLPIFAFEHAPAVAAITVSPEPGSPVQPITAGEPMPIEVRAFTPPNAPQLQGVIRWRNERSPHWQEELLEDSGGGLFRGQWTPPAPGDYQWTVELWPAGDGNREGSSEPDRFGKVRAERRGICEGAWQIAARQPLAELTEAGMPQPVLLLPAVFGMADDLTVGANGKGHYTIDSDLGSTREFGLLASAAHQEDVLLGMTIPLRCSPDHPFLQRDPHAFDETGLPDLLGADWRSRWDQWEAVFRFWIVQGIDLFYLPDATAAPLSFWRNIIANLRADFPTVAFASTEPQSADYAPHWLAAGFACLRDIDVPAATATTEPTRSPNPIGALAPLAPLPATTEVEAADPNQPAADGGVECFCSNPQLIVTLYPDGKGAGELHIRNNTPDEKQAGHVHLDAELMDLQEHERYYLQSLADGRAYRWSGTTNFMSLEAGNPVTKFHIDRT